MAAKERKKMQLYTKILLGLVAGVLAAVIAKVALVADGNGPVSLEQLERFGERWVEPIGMLFIRAIVLTVVPLVFSSLTAGIYRLGDIRALGRMGGKTLGIFMATAFCGALMATVLVDVLQPGATIPEATRELLSQRFAGDVSDKADAAASMAQQFEGSVFQVLLGLVPENIVTAMGNNRFLLKVIIFALLFGTSMTLIEEEKVEPLAKVIEGVNEVMVKIITLLMGLAPYGVFALVFMVVVRFGADVLLALAAYTGVVLLGLLIHLVAILMPAIRILAKRKPIEFLRKSKEIWVTAFSTSSSSATLPTTMRVAEQELEVPRPVASFVLPLGATVNMDGTTIYQIIAAHFIAQVWNIPISPSTMLITILVAMAMAIGAAGVPGGVIPLLYVLLATVGISEEIIPVGIALILGMDRILDMARSALNVIGDTATACIVAQTEAAREARESG